MRAVAEDRVSPRAASACGLHTISASSYGSATVRRKLPLPRVAVTRILWLRAPQMVEPTITVRADADLRHAAELMAQFGTSHVIVTERGGRRAVGVLSSLDIAKAVASM
jgi:CBS domain-containing protein